MQQLREKTGFVEAPLHFSKFLCCSSIWVFRKWPYDSFWCCLPLTDSGCWQISFRLRKDREKVVVAYNRARQRSSAHDKSNGNFGILRHPPFSPYLHFFLHWKLFKRRPQMDCFFSIPACTGLKNVGNLLLNQVVCTLSIKIFLFA